MARGSRSLAALAIVSTVVVVAACGVSSGTPLPTPDEALFPDLADRTVAATLTRTERMTFAAAGPHHVLGTAPDGTQLDIVGHPPSEVVVSVPARVALDLPGAVLPAYLPAAAQLIAAPPDALIAWVRERLAGWQTSAGLDARTTLAGITVELRTIGDPRFLRLRLTGG